MNAVVYKWQFFLLQVEGSSIKLCHYFSKGALCRAMVTFARLLHNNIYFWGPEEDWLPQKESSLCLN